MPVAASQVTATELQQSIFNAPPSSSIAPSTSQTSPAAKAPEATANTMNVDREGPQGVKRRREDESDDEGAPMEEGDSDAPMDASSDEDSS